MAFVNYNYMVLSTVGTGIYQERSRISIFRRTLAVFFYTQLTGNALYYQIRKSVESLLDSTIPQVNNTMQQGTKLGTFKLFILYLKFFGALVTNV